MKIKLLAAPWGAPRLTEEAEQAIEIIGKDIWKEASIRFYAVRDAKIKAGKSAPKGMQRFLNEVLTERFNEFNWDGDSGYFFKNRTWVRVTFRHQMSLGTDIIDALKVCKREKMELVIILAASRTTLDTISPNDAAALISFEKLQKEVLSLDGVIDIPLIIGELTPNSLASKDINEELNKERPRDVSVPLVTAKKH